MATCPKCNHTFVCTEHTDKVGDAVQECPLQKGAIWAQVQHDGKREVQGVRVQVGRAVVPTDELGYSAFDPLAEDTYEVSLLDLQGKLADRYELALRSKKVTVKKGRIASPLFEVTRRAWLKIKLVVEDGGKRDDHQPPPRPGAADVTVTGPKGDQSAQRTVRTDAETGIADFGWAKVGDYTVAVALGHEDANRFAPVEESHGFPLPAPGGDEAHEEPLNVAPFNVVTAKVAMADTHLIIDHGPESREAPAAHVDLSLAQTNPAHRYEKVATFKCASDTDVEAFLDEGCLQPLGGDLGAGVALPEPKQADLRAGRSVDVYLRGKTTAGKLALSLELADPANRLVKLGDKPAPVEADIELLARPHVTVEWVEGGGVDLAKVQLAVDDKATHMLPDSTGGGFAKWTGRGIKPGAYGCMVTLDGVTYLLHDESGKPVTKPTIDLRPGGAPAKFKIRKAEVKLAVTCQSGGVSEDVEAEVKIKAIGGAIKLEKGKGAVPVKIAVTKENQQCEIESFTPAGGDVYELVKVDST
jgi:hypothetical protein